MRIHLIEQDQARDQVRRIYDSLAQRLDNVSNSYKMLAHKPKILRAFSQLYAALWADSALPITLKEQAHLRVSIVYGCAY
jgi:alkylhydroperoxidase family enzyme